MKTSSVGRQAITAGFLVLLGLVSGSAGLAQTTKGEDGKYVDAEGTPTFNITEDGTVDWYTYSGFRRYHSECHVCHGPDGEGSSYAPGLLNPLRNLDYMEFMTIVASGMKDVGPGSAQQVMPALGENPNVMCYLDDIYVYLRARAEGGLPRGRPQKHEDKPKAATEHENACFAQ